MQTESNHLTESTTNNNMATNKLLPNRTTKSTPLKLTLISLGVLILTIAIILWPFLFIWSLNSLFHLTIPFTISNWLASLVILSVFAKTPTISNKNKD